MNRTLVTRPDAQGSAKEPIKNSAKGRAKPKEKAKQKEGHRETVEALVFAFILALLVRGFEAEAFVIPTGSMAPTLMGRHKEIACPQCGYVYTVNASEEDEGGRGVVARIRGGDGRAQQWVVGGMCVNCRFQAPLKDAPTFNGDRILVMKFPYDMPFLPGSSGPERWDVVVFRFPEEPEVSYIKRLVGLSDETVRIYFGDIYVKGTNDKDFGLARKPLRHQQSMQIMVNDDRFRPTALNDRPEWDRWTATVGDTWKVKPAGDDKTRRYVVEAVSGQPAELRYKNLVPDYEQWTAILEGEPLPRAPRASLITDFYSYNTNETAFGESPTASAGGSSSNDGDLPKQHWVGDLTVSSNLKIVKPTGLIQFELIEGGVSNRCVIDVKTGMATLFHGNDELGKKVSKINANGEYAVTFANVDDRLTVLVDEQPLFGDGLPYEGSSTAHPAPTEADLSPVRILATDTAIEVSDLVLKRDIYYTQYPGRSDYASSWDHSPPGSGTEMLELLSDPAQFPELGNLKSTDYAIGSNRFMMLGDNSPRSKDGRGWANADRSWDDSGRKFWEVPRSLLTGKAFFVYWPHGKPTEHTLSLTRDLKFPFLPYFARMRWIR